MVRPLARDDEPAATEVLARAFRDSPLDRVVVGGSAARRLRAERAGMAGTLVSARGRADVRGAWHAGHLAGVLVALPPWSHPLPPPPLGMQLRTLLHQGLRVARRWREVFETFAAHHPPEPCWYLSLVGVEPALQGRGLGSALLGAWLADVDAEPTPAFLETAREESRVLYERFGFAVAERIEVLGIGVWLMVRPARPAV